MESLRVSREHRSMARGGFDGDSVISGGWYCSLSFVRCWRDWELEQEASKTGAREVARDRQQSIAG